MDPDRLIILIRFFVRNIGSIIEKDFNISMSRRNISNPIKLTEPVEKIATIFP
jgi:hypothetical protein